MTNATALHGSGAACCRHVARPAARVIPGIRARLRRAHREWRQAEHLTHLNDHLLRDLGIDRCDIEGSSMGGWCDRRVG